MKIERPRAAAAELIEAARETLPPTVAEAWIGLLRPAVRLRRAGDGEQVVARLGGSPALPDGVDWPRSAAGRPLGFIAGIDLGRVPAGTVDLPLPDGTLLLFYRDPSEDPYEHFWISDPIPEEQPPTGRAVFVPAGTATTVRTEPGAAVYPEVHLAAEPVVTGPDWDHPALVQAAAGLPAADQAFLAEASNSDDFRNEIVIRTETPRHYLGGYAHPMQSAVELTVAAQRVDPDLYHYDPARLDWDRVLDEARHWTSLVQIDSDEDADMVWGDHGSLYWVIHSGDLAAGRLEAATFTGQFR
jgi:uncharacterized protein YwqG